VFVITERSLVFLHSTIQIVCWLNY